MKGNNMIITDKHALSFLPSLYHVAAKDKNDIIANAASSLAVRFEKPSAAGHRLNDLDVRLIRYSIEAKKNSSVVSTASNRKAPYKRRSA
jgi:hypothetical protein